MIKIKRSAVAAVHEGFGNGSSLVPSGEWPIGDRIRQLAQSLGFSAVLSAITKSPYEPMSLTSLTSLTLEKPCS